MKAKITKRVVDAAAPRAATYLIRDTEVKGFVLVVTPAGSRSYALDYRAGTGRRAPKRRYTIGKHGSPWTPELARREAIILQGEIKDGHDPAVKRKAAREMMTFAELCDAYLAEGVSHKKASTLKADKGRIVHHLKPLLGGKRVDQITRPDVERMVADVTRGKTAKPLPAGEKRTRGSKAAGGGGVAAQCAILTGTILQFAIVRGMRGDNPAHGVKKRAVRKLERFLSEAEIGALTRALDADQVKQNNPYPAAAIKLLLTTGCRRGEIIGLQWSHVDVANRCLRLPDSKSGQKIVYLNAPALALLEQLPRVAGNPFVIVGERGAFGGIDKVWNRVRDSAGIPDVRIHDLRHSFASIGAVGGLSMPILGALLGHKNTSTTERYAHLSADPLRAANDAVGAVIAEAMARKKEDQPPANVTQFKRRQPAGG